jgi:uncharacterized phiE125 gp8 family phage protein
MRQIKINSVTGSEIVTTQDVKDYVRIDTSADDAIIGRMIEQARIWCENYISRDIVAKTRTYYVDSTTGVFDIPFAPVDAISSVTVQGEAAEYSVLGLDNETIELDGGSAEQVKVTYATTGLSDGLLKQAILQLVSTYYDNRADFISDTATVAREIPTNVKSILSSYKSMFV